jgi:hypothetical protein
MRNRSNYGWLRVVAALCSVVRLIAFEYDRKAQLTQLQLVASTNVVAALRAVVRFDCLGIRSKGATDATIAGWDYD